MRLVYAVASQVLLSDELLPFTTNAGEPWDADDALVKKHPAAFSLAPPPETIHNSRLDMPEWMRGPEQATREPGEIRPMRRV